jgi:hypothetical protein
MTIQEMHNHFKILLDKVDSASFPEFLDSEIDTFLNLASREFVKRRYKEFEYIQKRRDDLRTLVTEVRISDATFTDRYSSTTGTYEIGITANPGLDLSDYWFFLAAELRYMDVPCGVQRSYSIDYLQTDDYYDIKRDPFNKPRKDAPVQVDRDYMFEVDLGEKLSITNYTNQTYVLRYLRKPIEVNLNTNTDSDLPEHTHEEVVYLAVRKALENVEAQGRYQTLINEITTNE